MNIQKMKESEKDKCEREEKGIYFARGNSVFIYYEQRIESYELWIIIICKTKIC
jgi:uncharacterized beta-barrel protein YwiB (DUF1934 family)